MRIWRGNEGDHGSLFSIGNGKIAVYEQGPDIVQIFGPPYTSNKFAEVRVANYNYCESVREKGSAIWNHTIKENDIPVVAMTDFSGDGAQFYRIVEAEKPLDLFFYVKLENVKLHYLKAEGVADSIFIRLPRDMAFWGGVNSPDEQCLQIVLKGNAKAEIENDTLYIKCGIGRSELIFMSGYNYPECLRFVDKLATTTVDEILASQRKYWAGFNARLKPVMDAIPDIPLRDRLIDAIDSTSVIIKTQQSDEGGVLAGALYHMAYVRDEYGVGRGLIKMGLYHEARLILEYYLNIFNRHGRIQNAQGMGMDGFHIHENDSTEIPGYLVMQAFDYYDATGDEQLIKRLLPMLKWAVEEQATQLHKNMMPFNGDETYIAGGIYPRSAIDHGSAEATMMFANTYRLLDWLDARNLDVKWSAHKRRLVNEVRQHFAENFIQDGKLMTNNPDRFDIDILPEFRLGGCTYPWCNEFFKWGRKNKYGAFACPECEQYDHRPDMGRYEIMSTNLIPFYMKSDLVPAEIIRPLIEKLADEFIANGTFSTRPGANKTVGYDYGLLLYNAVILGLDNVDTLAEKVLDKLDDTDAWTEYYVNGSPYEYNCRYRPWESAMNLEALLLYADSRKK